MYDILVAHQNSKCVLSMNQVYVAYNEIITARDFVQYMPWNIHGTQEGLHWETILAAILHPGESILGGPSVVRQLSDS